MKPDKNINVHHWQMLQALEEMRKKRREKRLAALYENLGTALWWLACIGTCTLIGYFVSTLYWRM